MLHSIAEKFARSKKEIQEYFEEKSRDLTPPLYLSCDIRNSGRKLAVVDTNLFPAGFNNLCNSYSRTTTQALQAYFDKYLPEIKTVILLIEEHTRNRFYLENISRLSAFLQGIGLKVGIAYPGVELHEERIDVPLEGGTILHLEKLQVREGIPQTSQLKADLVLSNNDFSQGVPEILKPILSKVRPAPALGWHRRRKSRHFTLLREITEEFAQHIDLDPWLLQCLFDVVEPIDLNLKEDVVRLAASTEGVLKNIQAHYDRYHVEESPYVFVKNDAGTYGMGVIEVMQSEELSQMNRRVRNKLLSAKGGQKVSSFLVQEGIPTADFYSGFPIEPVIYMVGFEVVGGFFRMNPQQDAFSSLNSRGMEFSCLCLHKLSDPHEESFLNCAEKANLVWLASIMARLAALAAALEMKEI